METRTKLDSLTRAHSGKHSNECTHTHTGRLVHSRPKKTDCHHFATSTHSRLLVLLRLVFVSCRRDVYHENREDGDETAVCFPFMSLPPTAIRKAVLF